MSRKFTTEEAKEIVSKIGNGNYELIGEYNGTNYKTPSLIKCKKHNRTFLQNMSSFFSGKCGCPDCMYEKSKEGVTKSRVKKGKRIKDTESFILKAKARNSKEYDYSKTIWINNDTPVIITCPEHGDFSITPKQHIQGQGCPICAHEARIEANTDTFEEFLVKATKIHHDLYDYSLAEKVYVNSATKIPIICKKHEWVFYQRPVKHVYGQGCPICRLSHGARRIFFWLVDHSINPILEYEFDDCRDIDPLPFDFYLPELNTCIEYHGRQHFEEIEAWESHGGLSYRQRHDKIKFDYCVANNIPLYTITYKDYKYIEEILDSIFF